MTNTLHANERIYLVEPTMTLKAALLGMADDFDAAGERYGQYDLPRHDFGRFLAKLADMSQGRNLPPGIVPMDIYWLVRDGVTVLGESRLRHALTPALKIEGGHIGYAIRPSERRKGYGTLILELTLEKARAFGLKRAMVTCDTDNLASARIIEKNGGRYYGQAVSSRSGKRVLHYWIDL